MRLFQRLGYSYLNNVHYITFSTMVLGGVIGLEHEIANPYVSALSPQTLYNVTKTLGYGALYGITYPVSIPIHLMHVFYWSKHKYNYALCVMSNYPRIK